MPSLICGVDVSSLLQVEAGGGIFYDAHGAPIPDVLIYLQSQGVNAVRLRLWHTPPDGVHDLDDNLTLARRIHANGMIFLLDIHYSDTWADPAHQTKPAAWADLSFTDLRQAVYDYTADVMQAFIAQNTPPDMVQIGNEISGGMLWDDGWVQGEAGWSNLALLLQAGADAVRHTSPHTRIMLHVDTGGDRLASQWFFDHIIGQVDFDIIGLSYYPWWAGGIHRLRATLNRLAYRYAKPIIVVETAYPWTLAWADDTHNPVGASDQLQPDYPATPDGQHHFLMDVITTITDTRDNMAMGFFYWEPAYISAPAHGSFWENLAQFDFDGRALPSLAAYGACLSVITDEGHSTP
jgi:arabinogalactan endo-1,4-beta-galactosidase